MTILNGEVETSEEVLTPETQEEVTSEIEEVVEPEETADEDLAEEPGEYVPNMKYNFMDEELEFDDKIKGFIKSKEDEDFFRDMVTAQKAHEKYKELGGIRDIQSKIEEYPELETVKKSFNELNTEVDQLQGMLKSGNIEQFRDYLGIPKEQLLKWAANEARAMQDPNEAARLQQEYQQQQQNFNLQYQHDMMQNNIQQQQIQERHSQLDAELGSSPVAQAYDNLVGAGSFRQAVIDHGLTELQRTGRDVTVQEALQAVQDKFKGLVASETVGTQNPENSTTTKVNDPKQTVVINQGGQKTIPNLRGGGTSPAKKKFTSLAQIKAHAKTL
jgi:hypothetical protein